MIDFVAQVLVLSLQYISPNDILKGEVNYNAIPLKQLEEICYHTDGSMDESSLRKKLDYLKEWILVQLDLEGWQIDSSGKAAESGISIFDLIHCLIAKVLSIRQGRVVYRYKYLEVWNYLCGKIGTNLLAASLYAYKDHKAAFERKNFADTEVLYHDNQALNEVLARGISDNHCHLHCSSPYFILSWLSLMNSVTVVRVSQNLDKISEHPRNPKVRYRHNYEEDSFVLRHLKAALIRVYLYAYLTGEILELGEYNTPMKWLIEHVCDAEPVGRLLGDVIVNGNRAEGKSLVEYLEELEIQERTFLGRIESIRKNCKGFYWLFWGCYPEIAMECFAEGLPLFCSENIDRAAKYIEREYKPLPLSQCAWLFSGEYQQKYRAEWDWQSKQTIQRLLSDQYELQSARSSIQHAIDSLHMKSSARQKDYVLNSIEWEWNDWERSIITGERWLMYQIEHRKFYSGKSGKEQENDIYNLFFAYLVIKESFRSELLQNNDKIGFQNFQIYQARKSWFTTAFSDEEMVEIAVKGAFRKQNLKSLELRVMPQENAIENIRGIRLYDKAIGGDKKKDCKRVQKKYYYVVHFGKKQDDLKSSDMQGCRHEAYRKKIKKLSNEIMSMREKNPEIGGRLKGIDACSSEDGCRPEVFATAFRELKAHTVYRTDIKKNLPQLRISYHVGEESQDVLDGLRAIDEAVYFLNMESGDRLGHATMLGINVEEWYSRKQNMISIRQHDYLDNVSWLYHAILRSHVSNQDNLLEYLGHEFQVYFNRIYEQHMSKHYNEEILKKWEGHVNHDLGFNIHNYYYAWELRGDDPALYAEGFYQRDLVQGASWGDQAINRLTQTEWRNIPEAAILYHTYHYNEGVRREGEKPVVIKIPYYMVCGIALVQKYMQNQIAKNGIAIETNPTSNRLIAGLKGYESHPIISFYNKGLVGDPAQLEECPQINVSINTDDQGTFTTSLYNEYTLMANALEGLKGEDGTSVYKKDRVYDWINNIRKMGNKQPFSKDVLKESSLSRIWEKNYEKKYRKYKKKKENKKYF